MTITSKIWDIAEQTGQQGGLVLWAHNQGTFTPYPRIVSFESINITGDSTVVMPASPTDNSIPNKKYIDDLIAGLDVPDLFDWKWKDCTTSKSTWALADGNWVTNKEEAYKHLLDEFNSVSLTKWQNATYGDIYTQGRFPAEGNTAYSDSGLTTPIGTITATGQSSISVNDNIYMAPEIINEQSETIAGTTIKYCLAADGHKICLGFSGIEYDVNQIYNATGAAWYYLLDGGTQQHRRFKLPRVNPVREELIQTIKAKGSGLTLGLMSTTGHTAGLTTTANNNADLNWNGSAYNTSAGSAVYGTGPTVGTIGVTTEADKSGIVSDMTDSTSVFSGKKYLYFYVGH